MVVNIRFCIIHNDRVGDIQMKEDMCGMCGVNPKDIIEKQKVKDWIEKRKNLIGLAIANIEDGYEIGEPKRPQQIKILCARLDILEEFEKELKLE